MVGHLEARTDNTLAAQMVEKMVDYWVEMMVLDSAEMKAEMKEVKSVAWWDFEMAEMKVVKWAEMKAGLLDSSWAAK